MIGANHPPTRAGVTIMELLVALLIGAVAMGMLSKLFISNQRQFRLTEEIRQMEENGRTAIEFLARDVRASENAPILTLDNERGEEYDNAAQALSAQVGSDITRIFKPELPNGAILIKPSSGATACEAELVESGNQISTLKIPLIELSGATDYSSSDPDAILDRQAHFYICEQPNLSCLMDFASQSSSSCAIEITMARQSADEAAQPSDCAPALKAFHLGEDMCVSIGRRFYYYVSPVERGVAGSTTPQLIRLAGRSAEVIANNVADMQLEYGYDFNGDMIVDSWAPSAVGANKNSPTESSDAIVASRIELAMETSSSNQNITSGSPPKLLNTTAAIDSRPKSAQKKYRVISRVVKIRNKNMK